LLYVLRGVDDLTTLEQEIILFGHGFLLCLRALEEAYAPDKPETYPAKLAG